MLAETLPPSSYLDDPVLDELRVELLRDWPYATVHLLVAEDAMDALLVVDRAMDALDLLTRALLRPGDLVVVENPGFPPLLDLLEDRGVEVVGVPPDEDGIRPEPLEALLPRRPAALVLQPRGHNPTGV